MAEIHSVGPYILGKSLGSGTTGKVKLAFHKDTGAKVAIKIVQKNYLMTHVTMLKKLEREIAVMKVIDHPNVLKIYDVYETSKYLFMVLEYAEGGELFDYLVKKGKLSEEEARNVFSQIIAGIDYCHINYICHRDLKPENVLLTADKKIKIADFGMASLSQKGQLLKTSCGSPHYASPEVVMGQKYDGRLADIWSCGVILFALLTGKLPFDDDNIRQLLAKVKSGIFTMPSFLSKESKDLIQRMLTVDVTKRITLEEVKNHAFFSNSNANAEPFSSQLSLSLSSHAETLAQTDDEIVRSLHSLGLGTIDTVQKALKDPKPNLEKCFYHVLHSRKQNPPFPPPANPTQSAKKSSSAPISIPGTTPSQSPLQSPLQSAFNSMTINATSPPMTGASPSFSAITSSSPSIIPSSSPGSRQIRRRVSVSFGSANNPFGYPMASPSIGHSFDQFSVGSTPKQSWFSSFFQEMDTGQNQRREGIFTHKSLENILGELESLFQQYKIKWESVNNRQIRAYFQGETIGNQASFLVEVLNNSETDELSINFIQEAGSEKTFNQLCRSLEENLAKNLGDSKDNISSMAGSVPGNNNNNNNSSSNLNNSNNNNNLNSSQDVLMDDQVQFN